jgi:hypothetical protein
VIGSDFGPKYYSSSLNPEVRANHASDRRGLVLYKCDNDIQSFLLPEQNAETAPTITA